jgi:hypothetical protein
MCQQFSGNARGYMLGYHHQALETEDGREEVKSSEQTEKIQKPADLTRMQIPLIAHSSHG